jgi:CO/xanthine dehydrogenase Mo-binding subunit
MTRSAGRSITRSDARAKVTGEALYAVDAVRPDMLYGVVLRADRAHARIRAIDTSEAAAADGVAAVITADDLDGLFPRFGHIIADHPILAIERVRYYGEPVVLVVGTSRHAAADAARMVRIDYEDLPVVIGVDEALDPDAAILHDGAYDAGDKSFDEAISERGEPTNVAHEAAIEWGDVDAAFAEAPVVVETRTEYPMLYAYAMEPYNALAAYEEGSLEVVTTAQHPYQVREDLARVFSLPLSAVRVTSPYLGGGYGSKSYTKVEPLAAVGSWVTRRPVKVALDVEEAIYTTRADGAVVHVRSAFDEDGTLLARDITLDLNSGAYADNSPLVVAKAVHRSFGPYRVPNLRVRGRSVYTNTTPASSYRGFGAPQGNLAGELNMDQAAERLGIDPAELRRRNLVRPGEELLPGKRPMDADLPADLDMILESLEYSRERDPHRGIGFGCAASDAGAFPVSTASVRIQADGSVVVLSGSTEMGQGSRTALAQIAATELGVPLELVRVVQSDTAVTPYERTTGASRTTTLTGLAIQRACADALAKLVEMAADAYGVSIDEVKTSDGIVAIPGRSDLGFADVIQEWFGSRAGEVTGVGLVRKSDATAQLPPFWEIGMVGVEVSVDPDTGYVTVERLSTVGDVGYAINPALVEGQDLGAATQGLGAALFEELVYDGPQPANPNVVDYRVPRTRDIPRIIDTMLAERRDGVGPYGAKGSGEGALNPIGGAVASAIGRATGVWPDRLPLTPERVWRLLRSRVEE